MADFVMDFEADGPVPGPYSGVCFGVVLIKDPAQFFYGQLAPISERWIPEALAVSGFTREQHLTFPAPEETIPQYLRWINQFGDRHTLFSDNNQFDGMFNAYYTCVFGDADRPFEGSNPFGFSSRRIGDLACGAQKHLNYAWKHLRKTRHTHDPVDDATGNAEALVTILDQNGIKGKIR